MSNQTSSNETSRPKSNLPAPLAFLNTLLVSLEDGLDQVPDVDGPEFGPAVDRQILHQLVSALQEIRIRLELNSDSRSAQKDLFRIIALLERTRGRLNQSERAAAREATRQLAIAATPENTEDTSLTNAIEFLQAELAEGSRRAQDLFTTAESLGISKRTLNRAKFQIGVRSAINCEDNKNRHWQWSLPTRTTPTLGHSSSASSLMPNAECLVPALSSSTQDSALSTSPSISA